MSLQKRPMSVTNSRLRRSGAARPSRRWVRPCRQRFARVVLQARAAAGPRRPNSRLRGQAQPYGRRRRPPQPSSTQPAAAPLRWLPRAELVRRAAMESPGPPPTCTAGSAPSALLAPSDGGKSKVICWDYTEKERWVDPILRRAEELHIAKRIQDMLGTTENRHKPHSWEFHQSACKVHVLVFWDNTKVTNTKLHQWKGGNPSVLAKMNFQKKCCLESSFGDRNNKNSEIHTTTAMVYYGSLLI
ncbi:uncharacterized protein LOC117243684 [Parus major]|uniref:uncharacterized protein LOC117243684 n=1 Tax=Parus major TaxID=9157 RepID=UPI001443BD31|nr:uncharacterized protein LOC117243684 [Parus major]